MAHGNDCHECGGLLSAAECTAAHNTEQEGIAEAKARRRPLKSIDMSDLPGVATKAFYNYLNATVSDHIEPAQIERDAMRMTTWARFVLENRNPAARRAKFAELFGSEGPNDMLWGGGTATDLDIGRCPRCCNRGLYYSEECRPRQHNRRGKTGPGWIVCDCPAGNQRRMGLSGKAEAPPIKQEGY